MWTCSVDAAGAAIRKIVVGPSRLPLARGKKGIIKLSQSVIIPRIPQKSSNSCRGMDAREGKVRVERGPIKRFERASSGLFRIFEIILQHLSSPPAILPSFPPSHCAYSSEHFEAQMVEMGKCSVALSLSPSSPSRACMFRCRVVSSVRR